MTSAPLLLLAVSLALGAPRPTGAPEPPSRAPVDPAVLSPEARAEWEADPGAFEKAHGDALEAHRRWNQDPSLGQAECLAAKREPRSCMEGRLREMSAVVKPQALAVINSYVKLLPRGVDARIPAASEDGGFGRAEAAPAAPASARPDAPANPKPSGARFSSPPPARGATAPPQAPSGKDVSTVDEALNWICSYVPCART